MTSTPDDAAVSAWVALARAYRLAFATFETRLKAESLPPMAWYDALWELEKAGEAGLRPFELEQAMLFEQYNLSRLVERLARAGLVERCACPEDRRGQVLSITAEGKSTRARMWRVYGEALAETIGGRLDDGELRLLAGLLRKLG
ncbi:MAG: MarR family winged helix-turn-helix transcriptional regulator [Nitratireductor sp.]